LPVRLFHFSFHGFYAFPANCFYRSLPMLLFAASFIRFAINPNHFFDATAKQYDSTTVQQHQFLFPFFRFSDDIMT
jgi:hypothetical protein